MSPTETKTNQNKNIVKVWDIPTRLFHWCLAALVLLQLWFGFTKRLDAHFDTGFILLAVLLFRYSWGFIGSTTARFAHFVASPVVVARYLKAIITNKPAASFGHNPAGGWVIVVMFGALSTQIATGLFAQPLGWLVSADVLDMCYNLHSLGAWLIAGLIVAHWSAALFYWLVRGDNLVLPLITGKKHWPASNPQPKISFAPLTRALAVICMICAGILWFYRYVYGL